MSGKAQLLLIISFMLLGYALSFAQSGNLDLSFDQGTGADHYVVTTSIQPDGKIIIGGWFASYNGTSRNGIARLNADGSLDTSFDPGMGISNLGYPIVSTTSIQQDGKIIIGGSFNLYNGTARNGIARLNTDGSLDTSFNVGTGVDGSVSTTSIQSDGRIIIGGFFNLYNGTARNGIACLNTDGSLDTSFDPGTGTDNLIFTTAIQPDGKIIIGGAFTSYNGTARNRIARLNADGSLDTSFDPGTGGTGSPTPYVHTTAIQSDGKIIIGGDFLAYNGTARSKIARLNADGSLDTSFDPGTGVTGFFTPHVSTTSIQSDGKIIIGGYFTTYNGTARNYIARLNTDGSLDTSFDPGTGVNHPDYPIIYTTSIQSDGKIIIGGAFWAYNGTAVNCIARLESTPTGIHQLENAISNVYVFPNPFSNTTTIHTESELKNAVLTVYNPFGQSVKQITQINIGAGHTITLNRDNLPGGLYFIRLSQGNQIIMTDKLVVAD